MTALIDRARENAVGHIETEAAGIGADLPIGSAVKKMAGPATRSPTLIPPAVIRHRSTFFNTTQGGAIKLDLR